MRRIALLIVVALVLGACGGDADPATTTTSTSSPGTTTPVPTIPGIDPEDVDLAGAIAADPAAAVGVTSYRQRRTVEIAGTRAEQEGVAGSFQVSYELTTDPEALRMAVDASPALVPVFLEGDAITAIIAIGDDTWARDSTGEWSDYDPGDSTLNPLFGPFGGVVTAMEQLIAPSVGALQYAGPVTVGERDLYLYQAAEFVAVGPDETGIPITDLQVWIDPAGYMARALITVTSGSEADGDELAYILLYEAYDPGAPITIEPPV
jgi:hypothetical protein